MKNGQVNIGIIGLGTVGTGVARILIEQKELLKTRTTIDYNLKSIVELNWDIERDIDLTGVKCTKDVDILLEDPEINIVVETIGGYEPAYSFITKALKNKKYVVTANKALLAEKGVELYKIAHENGVDILFEASVGGGIPIIKSMREALVSNKFKSIYGILNGTSNYILTKMHKEGLDFSEALKGAQEKGFAEADPTLDINGMDAAHKLTILGSIASNSAMSLKKLYIEGIEKITKLDIRFAKSFGFTIKLLAIYKALEDGIDLRVHPTLIEESHLLANVNNELNAIFVTGDFVGNTMFYGPGAGEKPTASAIVGDIADISRDLLLEERGNCPNRAVKLTKSISLIPVNDVKNRFYLRFLTKDIPGVLSNISGVLGEHDISISSMVQPENEEQDGFVPIVLLTHEAIESKMEQAIKEILKFDFVKKDFLRLRVFSQQ